MFEYRLNSKRIDGCTATRFRVCLQCPSFNPDESYGGFMAFQCDPSDPNDLEGKLFCKTPHGFQAKLKLSLCAEYPHTYHYFDQMV